ncbi:hypothetical protein [Methanopyrus kandleri]
MFTSDVDVYAELRKTTPHYSKQIFLRFGVNCFGRHWTRIRSEARVPASVAKRVHQWGEELARELLPLGEELTAHDLGALGIIHDDWFSLGREKFWRSMLIDAVKKHPRIFHSIVILASRPPSAYRAREVLRPESVSGLTTKMILRRAERWRRSMRGRSGCRSG